MEIYEPFYRDSRIVPLDLTYSNGKRLGVGRGVVVTDGEEHTILDTVVVQKESITLNSLRVFLLPGKGEIGIIDLGIQHDWVGYTYDDRILTLDEIIVAPKHRNKSELIAEYMIIGDELNSVPIGIVAPLGYRLIVALGFAESCKGLALTRVATKTKQVFDFKKGTGRELTRGLEIVYQDRHVSTGGLVVIGRGVSYITRSGNFAVSLGTLRFAGRNVTYTVSGVATPHVSTSVNSIVILPSSTYSVWLTNTGTGVAIGTITGFTGINLSVVSLSLNPGQALLLSITTQAIVGSGNISITGNFATQIVSLNRMSPPNITAPALATFNGVFSGSVTFHNTGQESASFVIIPINCSVSTTSGTLAAGQSLTVSVIMNGTQTSGSFSIEGNFVTRTVNISVINVQPIITLSVSSLSITHMNNVTVNVSNTGVLQATLTVSYTNSQLVFSSPLIVPAGSTQTFTGTWLFDAMTPIPPLSGSLRFLQAGVVDITIPITVTITPAAFTNGIMTFNANNINSTIVLPNNTGITWSITSIGKTGSIMNVGADRSRVRHGESLSLSVNKNLPHVAQLVGTIQLEGNRTAGSGTIEVRRNTPTIAYSVTSISVTHMNNVTLSITNNGTTSATLAVSYTNGSLSFPSTFTIPAGQTSIFTGTWVFGHPNIVLPQSGSLRFLLAGVTDVTIPVAVTITNSDYPVVTIIAGNNTWAGVILNNNTAITWLITGLTGTALGALLPTWGYNRSVVSPGNSVEFWFTIWHLTAGFNVNVQIEGNRALGGLLTVRR